MDDENELSLIRKPKDIINNYKSDNLGKNSYMMEEDEKEERLKTEKLKDYSIDA